MVFLLDGPGRTGWERSGDGGDGPGERKVPKISGSGAPAWGTLGAWGSNKHGGMLRGYVPNNG